MYVCYRYFLSICNIANSNSAMLLLCGDRRQMEGVEDQRICWFDNSVAWTGLSWVTLLHVTETTNRREAMTA